MRRALSSFSPELTDDALNFWVGAELRCYDAQRCIVTAPKVIAFDASSARVTVAEAIPEHALSFELDAGFRSPRAGRAQIVALPIKPESAPG